MRARRGSHAIGVLVFLLAGCGAPDAPPTPVQAGAPPPATHRFQEIAPGVHFAVGTGVVNLVSNSLVIVNDDHVVVVDSHITPDAAQALIDSVATLTDRPIRYLVNTHFHFDHAHGNAAFPSDVVVVGHDVTRERLAGDIFAEPSFQILGTQESARAAAIQAEKRLASARTPQQRATTESELAMLRRHANAVGKVRARAPDLSLSRRLTLHGGGREIQLLFLGRGHTAGDVVVYLPAEKLLFTGDLLQPGAPYMGDGYPDEWIATLEALEELDFEWVLPGHGAPFSDRAEIARFKRFLRDFAAEARIHRAAGLAPEEAARRMRLPGWEDYAGWMLAVPSAMELQVRRIYELDDAG